MVKREIRANDNQGATDWKSTPTTLIVAPTRELASQIAKEAAKFVYGMDLKVANVYGGSDVRQQIRNAITANIVAATTGRLLVSKFLKNYDAFIMTRLFYYDRDFFYYDGKNY